MRCIFWKGGGVSLQVAWLITLESGTLLGLASVCCSRVKKVSVKSTKGIQDQ